MGFACCLLLASFLLDLLFDPEDKRQYICLKYPWISTKLHGLACQKIALFIVSACCPLLASFMLGICNPEDAEVCSPELSVHFY
jgi:hypothetical protein